jgi:hypothetical protein
VLLPRDREPHREAARHQAVALDAVKEVTGRARLLEPGEQQTPPRPMRNAKYVAAKLPPLSVAAIFRRKPR